MQAGGTFVAKLSKVVKHDVLLHPQRVDRFLSGYRELALGHAVGIEYYVRVGRVGLSLLYVCYRLFARRGGVGVGEGECRAGRRELLHGACRFAPVVYVNVYAAVLVVRRRKHHSRSLVVLVGRLAHYYLHGVRRGPRAGRFAEADVADALLAGKVFRGNHLYALAAFAAHLRQLQPVGRRRGLPRLADGHGHGLLFAVRRQLYHVFASGRRCRAGVGVAAVFIRARGECQCGKQRCANQR